MQLIKATRLTRPGTSRRRPTRTVRRRTGRRRRTLRCRARRPAPQRRPANREDLPAGLGVRSSIAGPVHRDQPDTGLRGRLRVRTENSRPGRSVTQADRPPVSVPPLAVRDSPAVPQRDISVDSRLVRHGTTILRPTSDGNRRRPSITSYPVSVVLKGSTAIGRSLEHGRRELQQLEPAVEGLSLRPGRGRRRGSRRRSAPGPWRR